MCSHRYTYIPSLLKLPPIFLPISPLWVDTEPLFEFPETCSKFPLAIYFTYSGHRRWGRKGQDKSREQHWRTHTSLCQADQFSHVVVSDSLRPHGLQQNRWPAVNCWIAPDAQSGAPQLSELLSVFLCFHSLSDHLWCPWQINFLKTLVWLCHHYDQETIFFFLWLKYM